MRNAFAVAVTIVAMVALASVATADVPQVINYQGWLTDSLGTPLDTTASMTFTIYDHSFSGTDWWTETHAAVRVSAGTFSVILGSIYPIDDSVFAGDRCWLEIIVEGETITPRTRLASSPFAMRVSTIENASGGTIVGRLVVMDTTASELAKALHDVHNYSMATRFLACGAHVNDAANYPALNPGHLHVYDAGGEEIIDCNGATGRVGIGTNDAKASLHVDGGILTLGGNGDLDGDGHHTLADIADMTDYLRGTIFLSEEEYAEADVDGDGRVTRDDLAILTMMVYVTPNKEEAWRQIHSAYGSLSGTQDGLYVRGNVGIGTDAPQGALDVSSTTGALIVPRMTTAERDALTAVEGMIIYNITTGEFNFREGGVWVTK